MIDGASHTNMQPVSMEIAERNGWGGDTDEISAEGWVNCPEPFFRHELPFQFAWWGANFFGEGTVASSGRLPRLRLTSFNEAAVLGQDGVVVLENGTELDRHLSFVQPYRGGSRLKILDGQLWRPELIEDHRAGTYLLGHTPAWSNYAHWLTESMPIWTYYAKYLKHHGVKLIVPPLSAVQREVLTLLDIDQANLVQATGTLMRFEKLLVPSDLSVWQPPFLLREASLEVLTKVVASGSAPVGKRIFLSRRDARTRRLLNGDAVEAVLANHGFNILSCSEMRFAEQVQAAAGADIVIGCHGAAMANILFCPEGCRVIELFPEYCAQPEYRAISARGNLPYGYVLGTSFDQEYSRTEQNSWDADFVIDISALERGIRAAISPGSDSD